MLEAITGFLDVIAEYLVSLAYFTTSAFAGLFQFVGILGRAGVEFARITSSFFPVSVWISIAGIIAVVMALALFRFMTRFL